MIVLNGKFTMPFCLDTGSDHNLISNGKAEELMQLDPSVKIEPLVPKMHGKAVGGHVVEAASFIEVKIRLCTAAGPVEPVQTYRCLVIDGNEDEFILGNIPWCLSVSI